MEESMKAQNFSWTSTGFGVLNMLRHLQISKWSSLELTAITY